jgi:hypothetical protein
MGLYQLYYSVGGAFEGIIFLEASSLGAALWRAERAGIASGAECDVLELHSDDARVIPEKYIGRLLDRDEVADLEHILIAGSPKKPATTSVRRPRARSSKAIV